MEAIDNLLHRKVHVKWWNKACVFRLRIIEDMYAIIETKRGKKYKVNKELIYPINNNK